jgi:hypothetical protein
MTNIQTTLLGAAVAEGLLLNICAVIACGQLHRLVKGVNAMVDLVEQADERQRRLMANIRSHDFDPQ